MSFFSVAVAVAGGSRLWSPETTARGQQCQYQSPEMHLRHAHADLPVSTVVTSLGLRQFYESELIRIAHRATPTDGQDISNWKRSNGTDPAGKLA